MTPAGRAQTAAGSGVVPFLVALLWTAFGPAEHGPAVMSAALAYGAVMAGFLGGVRWGAELARAGDAPSLGRLIAAAGTTVPAWAALIAPPWIALALLGGMGLAQTLWDWRAARAGLLPAWTWPLRGALAVSAYGCLVATVVTVAPPW